MRPSGVRTALLGTLAAHVSIAPGAAHAGETTGHVPTVIPRALPPGHPVSPASKSPPRGVTLGINGAILAGVGATFMGLAAVSLAEGASCARPCGFWEETSGTLLLAFGAPALVVGLPMFAVGMHRHRRWRAWERRRMLEIRPRLGAVTAGFELRF